MLEMQCQEEGFKEGEGLLSLTDFLSVIEDQCASLRLEANINLGTLSGANHREMADGLAYHVWKAMNLQFV